MKKLILFLLIIIIYPVQGISREDYHELILGTWRRYSDSTSLLLYEQYEFTKKGEAHYCEMYVEDQTLNKEIRKYYLRGNILSIVMKKLIGSGNEYYHFKIISLSKDVLIMKRLSKHTKTEPEEWKRAD